MTKGFVRDATYADVPLLVADLRPADVAEIKASSGRSPEEAIHTGVILGAKVACLPNGLPTAVFGTTPSYDKSLGFIWMVATNHFHLLRRQFIKESPQEIAKLCHPYRLVMNFTDARNHAHHTWLRWAGFTIIKRHEQFGVEKRPFLEFVRITEKPHV